MIVGIDDAREPGRREHPAALGDARQVRGRVRIGDVQVGGDHQVVPAEIRAGGDDVDADPLVPQRLVPLENQIRVGQGVVGVAVEFETPPGGVVEHQRRGRHHPGPLDRGEGAQAAAELDRVVPHLRVGAGVRDEGRVELLRTGPARPPLEEQGPVRAPRYVRERVAQHLPGVLGPVDVLPVHRRTGVLHEQPGGTVGGAAGQVSRERELDVPLRVVSAGVVIVADDRHVRPPREVVHALVSGGAHEVGRGRDAGIHRAHGRRQVGVVAQSGIGVEPHEVQLLGRVGIGGRRSGRQDVIEAAVALRPERRPPRIVEGVDVAVAVREPGPEGGDGAVGVVLRDVAPDLVVDVPQPHGGVGGVALGHPGGHRGRVATIDPGADRVGLASALVQDGAVLALGKDLRVLPRQPGRRGRGGGGQAHADAARVQLVDDLVEPLPVELALAGLDRRPGEDADADQVDPGLPHQLDVLVPDFAGPLLGVVVPTEGKALQVVVPCAHGSLSLPRLGRRGRRPGPPLARVTRPSQPDPLSGRQRT